jgi:hypothetical protein
VVIAGLSAQLWWELRNGRVSRFQVIPAERARQPRLFWAQVIGQAIAVAGVAYVVGSLIIGLVENRISN